MDRAVIKAWPDENRQHVTIQIEDNDKPLAHISLDAATTENHIHDLAKQRASLIEQVTPDLDPGSRIEAIVDPVWRISQNRVAQGRILCLRHPGLGWLSFVLPDKEAASMAEWLTKELPLQKTK